MTAASTGGYPPKLVKVATTAFGSKLSLSDGCNVPINIGTDRLSQALVASGRPPLSELLATHSLDVFAGQWETTEEDWQRISDIVRASQVASVTLRQAPSVWEVFSQPAALVQELPHRVYGGLVVALYTSHPCNFRPDPNRNASWYRSLLSATGGRLFNTSVNLTIGEVEIIPNVLVGHFIE